MKCKLLFLLVLAVISVVEGAEQSNKLRSDTLIEGEWDTHSPRSVVGQGWSRRATVTRNDGEWRIAFRHTEFFGVNSDKAPKTSDSGPYPVKIENGILTIIDGKQNQRLTFLISDALLVMPAIIQQKKGQWIWLNGSENFEVVCEKDPFIVPVGSATFPSLSHDSTFYSFELASRVDPHNGGFFAANPKELYHLRFFERMKEGYLFERFRLVFDSSHTNPWLQRADGGPTPPHALGSAEYWKRAEQVEAPNRR